MKDTSKFSGLLMALSYAVTAVLVGLVLLALFVVYEQIQWDLYARDNKCRPVKSAYADEHLTVYRCENGMEYRR